MDYADQGARPKTSSSISGMPKISVSQPHSGGSSKNTSTSALGSASRGSKLGRLGATSGVPETTPRVGYTRRNFDETLK